MRSQFEHKAAEHQSEREKKILVSNTKGLCGQRCVFESYARWAQAFVQPEQGLYCLLTDSLKTTEYLNVQERPWCDCAKLPEYIEYTVEPRYLELAYFKLPLISKWKSGPYFNMKLWQQVTKYCGKEEKLLLRSNFSSFPHYFIYIFLTSGVKLHIHLLNVVIQFIVFLTLSTLICQGTDISKCFSESLGIRDNQSRLYLIFSAYDRILFHRMNTQCSIC